MTAPIDMSPAARLRRIAEIIEALDERSTAEDDDSVVSLSLSEVYVLASCPILRRRSPAYLTKEAARKLIDRFEDAARDWERHESEGGPSEKIRVRKGDRLLAELSAADDALLCALMGEGKPLLTQAPPLREAFDDAYRAWDLWRINNELPFLLEPLDAYLLAMWKEYAAASGKAPTPDDLEAEKAANLWANAFETAAGIANRYGATDAANAIRALIPATVAALSVKASGQP